MRDRLYWIAIGFTVGIGIGTGITVLCAVLGGV